MMDAVPRSMGKWEPIESMPSQGKFIIGVAPRPEFPLGLFQEFLDQYGVKTTHWLRVA